MSTSSELMFVILFIVGYLGLPILLHMGLVTMAWSAKNSDCSVNSVPDRFYSGDCFRSLGPFNNRVRPSPSLSILRSVVASYLSIRNIAFYRRNRVWHRWCVAIEFASMARSRFRSAMLAFWILAASGE